MKLSGNKRFLKGFTVKKLVETEKLNGVPIEDIFTTYGKQEVSAPVIITGNVGFKQNITKIQRINDLPIDLIERNYEKIDKNTFKVNGEVLFNRLAYIKNLFINGSVNDEPVEPFVQNIVYKNTDFKINGPLVFNGKVIFIFVSYSAN